MIVKALVESTGAFYFEKKRRMRMNLVIAEKPSVTGISKRTIITIENEEGANPSVDTVKRLIKYFEISFEELYL